MRTLGVLLVLALGFLWLACETPQEVARERDTEYAPADGLDETRGWAEDDADR